MKIVSIEPTPSPNTMKINLDKSLPKGTSYHFSSTAEENPPQHIEQLLNIEGIKSVYQVNDFIALERDSKADWRLILPEVYRVFGEGPLDIENLIKSLNDNDADEYQGAQVFIQTVKGIPMQIKVSTLSQERRFPLPDRFMKAAQKVQQNVDNLLTARQWDEHGVRYGTLDEIGAQVSEEIDAAYDQQRLDELVKQAEGGHKATSLSLSEVKTMLNEPDWKKRFAALEQLKLTEEELPILEAALEDPMVAVRRLATAYLGEMGSSGDKDKILPLLVKALQDESAVVRRTAGDALSDIGDPQVIEPMIDALNDKSKIVRWRAARFMYEVGDERALPALRQLLNDPEFEISLQARMALERIEKGEKAEGTVWQQIVRRKD